MDAIASIWLWIFFVAAVLAVWFADHVVVTTQCAHELGAEQALNGSIVWAMASFAIATDPFVALASNVLAILGLARGTSCSRRWRRSSTCCAAAWQ